MFHFGGYFRTDASVSGCLTASDDSIATHVEVPSPKMTLAGRAVYVNGCMTGRLLSSRDKCYVKD